jgi:hypothetical protein
VRQQFSAVTEQSVNLKIGAFLAQSSDREGGRKERALRRQSGAADDDSSDQEQSSSLQGGRVMV